MKVLFVCSFIGLLEERTTRVSNAGTQNAGTQNAGTQNAGTQKVKVCGVEFNNGPLTRIRAYEPMPFWRENVVAVILLRVLAKMS